MARVTGAHIYDVIYTYIGIYMYIYKYILRYRTKLRSLWWRKIKLEKVQQSGVQLSSGVIWGQLKVSLKHIQHYGAMVLSGSRGAPLWRDAWASRAVEVNVSNLGAKGTITSPVPVWNERQNYTVPHSKLRWRDFAACSIEIIRSVDEFLLSN